MEIKTITDGGIQYTPDLIQNLNGSRDFDTALTGDDFTAYTAVSSGVSSQGLIITSGNSVTVLSGGYISSTTVNSSGYLRISSGGTANNTTVSSGGRFYLCSGGTANGINVNTGGYLRISSGGSASGLAVAGSARLDIVVAPDTWWNGTYNGFAFEMKDAVVSNYTVNLGDLSVSGGTAERTVVNDGGRLFVAAGGVANDTRLNAYGACYISSGGAVNRTAVNNQAILHIYSGGVTDSAAVSSGGILLVASGGVAQGTVVMSGGELRISSGGTHRGRLQTAAGAVVAAYSGAVIDFSAAGCKTSDDYLINDLSAISGNPVYTVTVSDSQTEGIYKLASGVENFTSAVLGSVGIRQTLLVGETYYIDALDNIFTLVLESGSLTLHVGDFSPAEIIITRSTETWTRYSVTVTAAAEDYSGIRSFRYSLDAGKTWHDYSGGIVMEKNGWIHFRAVDNSGNTVTRGILVNTIDNAAPVITISGNPVAFINKNVTVSMTAQDGISGIKRVLYSLDAGKTWSDYTSGVEMIKNGWVHFRAIDNAGNVTTKGVLVNKIDKAAPVLTISGNPVNYTRSNASVSAVAKDGTSGIKSLLYSLDAGKTWNTYTSAVSMEKNGWIHFRAVDNAGNVTTKGVLVNKIDKTAPVITFSGLSAGYTDSITVSASAQDMTSGIKSMVYSRDSGKTWQNYTGSVTFTQNGWIHVRAADNAGNVTTKGVLVNKIDNIVPFLQLLTSGNKVSAIAADRQSGLAAFEYSFDGENWFATANHKAISLKNGDSVTFRAVDKVGNVAQQQYDYNTIDYNALKNSSLLQTSSELPETSGIDFVRGLLA